jgi:RNA-binding protein Luc7-like 2
MEENYSAPDVCKYFLISFCPHDLFPNTKQDLGSCLKRHDEKFKKQFESDGNRI